VPGGRIDSPAVLNYIMPEGAAAVESRAFDYDILVRPMEGRMMRSIWRVVRHREAAEDALQDALTVIWKKRDAVARHPRPEALILRIAISSAIDAVRKNRRRLSHEVAGLPEDRAGDPAPPPESVIEGRGLRASVLDGIGRLPKRQATAVLLHIIEEQSYEDVARAMGCSESTVRVNVMRGRAGLARQLAGERVGATAGPDRAGKEGGS
jgi:RNA polymerase sigma factor (sigma-70 family)